MSASSRPSESTILPSSILIVGAGGHGCVVAELARACGYSRIDFPKTGAPAPHAPERDNGSLRGVITPSSKAVRPEVSLPSASDNKMTPDQQALVIETVHRCFR